MPYNKAMKDEDFLKIIVNLGTLGYDVEKCINVCDPDDEQAFKKDFKDKNSPIYKSYQRGVDKSDYLIDHKLYELATKGNLKALAKYEERKAFMAKQPK